MTVNDWASAAKKKANQDQTQKRKQTRADFKTGKKSNPRLFQEKIGRKMKAYMRKKCRVVAIKKGEPIRE